MIRIAGPKPKSRVHSGLPPSWIGSALISTLCSISSDSSPGSTNAGSVVAKVPISRGSRSRLEAWSPLGGYITGLTKRPVIVSPRL